MLVVCDFLVGGGLARRISSPQVPTPSAALVALVKPAACRRCGGDWGRRRPTSPYPPPLQLPSPCAQRPCRAVGRPLCSFFFECHAPQSPPPCACVHPRRDAGGGGGRPGPVAPCPPLALPKRMHETQIRMLCRGGWHGNAPPVEVHATKVGKPLAGWAPPLAAGRPPPSPRHPRRHRPWSGGAGLAGGWGEGARRRTTLSREPPAVESSES